MGYDWVIFPNDSVNSIIRLDGTIIDIISTIYPRNYVLQWSGL